MISPKFEVSIAGPAFNPNALITTKKLISIKGNSSEHIFVRDILSVNPMETPKHRIVVVKEPAQKTPQKNITN